MLESVPNNSMGVCPQAASIWNRFRSSIRTYSQVALINEPQTIPKLEPPQFKFQLFSAFWKRVVPRPSCYKLMVVGHVSDVIIFTQCIWIYRHHSVGINKGVTCFLTSSPCKLNSKGFCSPRFISYLILSLKKTSYFVVVQARQ